MTNAWMFLALSHLGVGVVAYQLAPREMLDSEVRQSGFFTVDTNHILSATVSSLRAEGKLQVYSFKGDARVSVHRSKLFGLLEGYHELIVPAAVSYLVPVSELGNDSVTYDPDARRVTVLLPPLVLSDIAFEPESGRAVKEGLLRFIAVQVDELGKINFGSARKAFTKQAQARTLVAAAEEQAIRSVQRLYALPLKAAGQTDVKVVATFEKS